MKKVFGFFLFSLLILSSCGGEEPETSSDEQEEVTTSDSTEVEVVETVEDNGEKRALLESMVGEYSLIAIEGNAGANAMMDYYIEDGEWTAMGSSIVNAMREAYDIELTEEDLSRLISSKIVVTEDLDVYYSCLDQQYFYTPFNPTGMTYKLKGNPEDFISGIPEGLNLNSTFINGDLFLYAEDLIDESVIKPIDIADVWADAATIYITEEGKFEMSLFYGDCCDNSIYFFEKD